MKQVRLLLAISLSIAYPDLTHPVISECYKAGLIKGLANLPAGIRLTVFSFLSGADLFQRIALLSKDIRTKLPTDRLLD